MTTPEELAWMRSDEELRFLPDRASVRRPPDPATAERTTSGAVKDKYPDDWTVVSTDAPCRIDLPERSSYERLGAGKLQAMIVPTGEFLHDQVIDETCRIRITSSRDNPLLVGKDFDVTAAPLASSPTTRHVELAYTSA